MRWLVALVGVSICGCSSGAYDAAYMKRVAAYRVAGEFKPLRPTATTVADGRAELRLPALLVNQLDGNEMPARASATAVAVVRKGLNSPATRCAATRFI